MHRVLWLCITSSMCVCVCVCPDVSQGSFASQRSKLNQFQSWLIPCLWNLNFSGLLLISVDICSQALLCSSFFHTHMLIPYPFLQFPQDVYSCHRFCELVIWTEDAGVGWRMGGTSSCNTQLSTMLPACLHLSLCLLLSSSFPDYPLWDNLTFPLPCA